MFEEQDKQELFETVKAFHAYKQENGQSLSAYLLKMKSYLDTLERLGYAMPKELGVGLILNSLNKDYDHFLQNYNMHSIGKTLVELHAMLKLHEKCIPKKAETPTVLKDPEGQEETTRGKGDNPVKDSICYHCKEVGHWRRNYPSYHAELKKRKNASVASTSDMHNLYRNVSSMYNVSNKRAKHALDSYYLWHCRLGHINKKHIDMLQCDGLLQPTHDESHEKCKSCISGKMARNPFPHQVERAKDLLGLIHTDVCGPFRIMSREGANYFITFTYDFSSCGFAYLMKHKHKVFETFKVFQNEVENQLDKKIKAIQSNRGGEYLTRDFVNHMKSCALQTVARTLNMVPTKKADRTPYKIWHGKALKLSYLRVWGCEALVKQDTPEKLDSRSIKCIFIANGSHGHLEMSRSDKGLELIKEEDTQPSKNTSKAHNEVAPIEEYELGDLDELPNYKVAIADLESDKWLEAMNIKIQSMRDNQAWYLVDLPSNGEAVYILRIKIICDRSKRLIALSQSTYLEKILKKFRMENSKKGYTPMMEKPDYRKSQGGKTPTEVQRMRRVPYALAVEMCQQSTAAMSSLKDEYIATAEASMEAVWMRKFIDELGDVKPSNKRPMEMLCDNDPTLAIASDPRI
nr:hypothetical protein [Tanacetum cinerariifolium]